MDSFYEPDESDSESYISDTDNEHTQDDVHITGSYFFVAWTSLLTLFEICYICKSKVKNISHYIKGTMLCVKSLCDCGNEVRWYS